MPLRCDNIIQLKCRNGKEVFNARTSSFGVRGVSDPEHENRAPVREKRLRSLIIESL